jgi:hypothetical protein
MKIHRTRILTINGTDTNETYDATYEQWSEICKCVNARLINMVAKLQTATYNDETMSQTEWEIVAEVRGENVR